MDPERFPLAKMRQFVDHLHANHQKYTVMVDPAVAWKDFPEAFNTGIEDDIFMRRPNGSVYKGVVWPGTTAFPDWFAANITKYWNNEFQTFFSDETGVGIDSLWIDMVRIPAPLLLHCSSSCKVLTIPWPRPTVLLTLVSRF